MVKILDNEYSLDEDMQEGKFLIFSLGNEDYGIEIRYITEIIGGIQQITEVPELPDYLKGIINLRGKIIPVMDVRLRFKKEQREYDERTCTIVVDIKDTSVGLVVDRVSEVINIPDTEIAAPPQVNKGVHHKYIKGIGKVGNEVKLLLDCDRLLSDDELEDITQII